MGIFAKNPNEANYVGGKKHWTDVIKNSGSGRMLIYRVPEEDFNVNSTLIVMPGEEAIFVKGGTIEQVFDNGTYKLSTENYPFISRLRNAFSGGISTFNCVVYFVRKADSEETKWGTETPIQVKDKVYDIRTEVRARGAYKVRIVNPAVFLEKLIGNNMTTNLDNFFSTEFQSIIRSSLSRFLNSLEQELVGIDAYLDELSEKIEPYIDEALQEYGVMCVKFSLAALDVDTTKYDAIDELQMGTIAQIKQAQGEKMRLNMLGDDWARVQSANILGTLAANPGAGGIGAMGAGMGMGMAAGGAFGSMANQMFAPMNGTQTQQTAAAPQQTSAGSRFAPKSDASHQQTTGGTADAGAGDPMEVLGKLKKMLDAGLIEQSEYDAKKQEVLSRL